MYLCLVGVGVLGVVDSSGVELVASGVPRALGIDASVAGGPGLGRGGWWSVGKKAMMSGGAFAGGAGWKSVDALWSCGGAAFLAGGPGKWAVWGLSGKGGCVGCWAVG